MFAQEEGDRRTRREAWRIAIGPRARGGREPRPSDLARKAEQVEHRRIVTVHARGNHGALPRAGRQLVAIERRDRFAQPVDAGQAIGGIDVLPLEEEAHEIGGADRLDLGAQAVDGVAMDARKQRAIAPFNGR